jgi:RNA polymerase sigma-70 factor (sigma-E family)
VNRSDEAAYREYVVARMDPLRRVAYLLCHDWHAADDLVSVTIAKLYRQWGRAQRFDSLDGYVRRILLNAWRDETRRPWRREDAVAAVPDRPAAAAEPDPGERLAQLEMLRRPSPRRRAAVVLRFYCDLSIQETAVVLGCSDGTVKSLTARGLESLRALANSASDGGQL